jgi:hypothetical protein
MKTTLTGGADYDCKTTAAPFAAGCSAFRVSEFTIKGDAARQVDCTQVFQWASIFCRAESLTPRQGDPHHQDSWENGLTTKKIAFA